MHRAVIARRCCMHVSCSPLQRSLVGARALAAQGAEHATTGTDKAKLGDGGYGDGVYLTRENQGSSGPRPGENRPDPARLQQNDFLERESKARPPLDIGTTDIMADKEEAAKLDRNSNVDWRHHSQFSQGE